jgi:hypothetical protein
MKEEPYILSAANLEQKIASFLEDRKKNATVVLAWYAALETKIERHFNRLFIALTNGFFTLESATYSLQEVIRSSTLAAVMKVDNVTLELDCLSECLICIPGMEAALAQRQSSPP